jgi:hypothetical protein
MLCFLIGTLEERLAVKNAAKASLRERAVIIKKYIFCE